jgi:SAM-dependent methyltransferase
VVPVLEVPRRFDRSADLDRATIAESALWLLDYTRDRLGFRDLSDKDVLDVGCGTKFSEAILNNDIRIGSYTGVDVYADMVDFLSSSVSDPRFSYHHADFHNALYNPTGEPMTARSDLGVGDRRFDVVWLFSVFTHLDPADYRTMLRMLRRYIRPEGRLFFTVYIDELTDGGHGFIDGMHRRLNGDEVVDVEAANRLREVAPFVDVFPDDPLKIALYSREHAHELIDGTGWTPLELLAPVEHAQHQFICAPV